MIPLADRAGLAFYNEFNDYAADWLERLIEHGLIAEGVVNRRSIADLEPADVQGYTQCHFFAGIGGWSLAARMAGWDDSRPLWTGSAPCQPFSASGKGGGTSDPRHLWPHFHRLIDAHRPPCIVGEQVAQQAGYDWLDGIGADLEASAYEWRAVDIPSCAVDSPQQRQRLYWVSLPLARAEREGKGRGSDARSRQGAGADSGRSPDPVGGPDGGRGVALDSTQGTGLEGQRRRSAPEVDGPREAGPVTLADDGHEQGAVADRHGVGRGPDQPERGPDKRAIDGRPNGKSPVADGDGAFERRVKPSRRLSVDVYHAGVNGGRNRSWWGDAEWIICHDEKARRISPSGAPLLAHGIRGNLAIPRPTGVGAEEAEEIRLVSRIGSWSGFGNAIVPPLAAEVLAALMEMMDE